MVKLSPKNDGETHINIYSKGQHWLGRELSNFAYSPFECEDGKFASIEGYWYWLGCGDDRLRILSGFEAKQYGRQVGAPDWQEEDVFKTKIKNAIRAKIEQNDLVEGLISTDLPFTHYYVMGKKVVEPQNGRWVIEWIEELRDEYRRVR